MAFVVRQYPLLARCYPVLNDLGAKFVMTTSHGNEATALSAPRSIETSGAIVGSAWLDQRDLQLFLSVTRFRAVGAVRCGLTQRSGDWR